MVYEEIGELVILIMITLAGYVVGLVATLFMLRINRERKRREEEERDYMKRLDSYERILSEIVTKLDAIESRINERKENHITYHDESHHITGKERSIEVTILNLLKNGAKSSREIEASIGRTREHTARVMKRLFEEGYVTRDTKERPYRYTLTETGRKILNQTV